MITTDSIPSVSSGASTVALKSINRNAVVLPTTNGAVRSLFPTKWQDTVRTLTMANCKDAGMTLSHAFATDDYVQYLVDTSDGPRDEETKWKLHVDILTYTVASHVLSGLVTTVGPDFDSVALWIPPHHDLDDWYTLMRSGLWRLYFRLPSEGKKRLFDEILPLLHDTKSEVLGKEREHKAWYLVYLGTKPNSQGRGYGSKLLVNMMERADAENRPIYLESSSLSNNVYYEKFGFEVKRDIYLRRGEGEPVRLSIMVREPVTQKSEGDLMVLDGGKDGKKKGAMLRRVIGCKKQKVIG
ncbi:puromycin N-acetyltransferase [Podospora fimiseda]|uniref:Puromycin N-acetyltransferase n=1 Tax=Podospora fimiseda TaxID=252190 RepID=A0AAN7BQH6_9PEZI|nr:puromycin N-acetyltransferase [Podospora fimiseda]